MKKKKVNKEKIIRVVMLCACMILIVGALCSSLVFGASALSSYCNHSGTGRYYSYENIGDPSTHVRYTRCSTCGASVDSGSYSHTFEDGVCADCGYVSADCDHYYEYVRSLPELQGTHADVYTCAYCGDTYYEYAIPCEYAVSSVDGVISGYCLSCSQECDHQWQDGYCPVCTFPCPHENHTIDGACSDCDMTSGAHNFNNVVREPNGSDQYHTSKKYCDCGYVETDFEVEHTYVGGKCSACEYQCTHSLYSETGVCVYCGAECLHNRGTYIIYSTVESVDAPDYLHWVRIYCVDCDVRVRTDPRDGGQEKCTYVDGVCTVCEHRCSHKRGYNNDTCIRCGLVCDHSVGFEYGGECKQCNYVCPHPRTYWHYTVTDSNADDDFHILLVDCTLCKFQFAQQAQEHKYNADYKCTACERYCKHSTFENIICKHCGYKCPHDSYTNGVCDLCGLACTHRWEKSVCKICALACENHTFTNGSLRCDICDYYVIYDGYQQNDGFFKLMTAIFDAQTNTYFSLLGYEILGVNIAYFVLSLVTLALAIIVFKIVKKVM